MSLLRGSPDTSNCQLHSRRWPAVIPRPRRERGSWRAIFQAYTGESTSLAIKVREKWEARQRGGARPRGSVHRKRAAYHRVPAWPPRCTRKNLHHPFVCHAFFPRRNLPAHYSSVYQRSPPSAPRRHPRCALSFSISFNLFPRPRDLPPLDPPRRIYSSR